MMFALEGFRSFTPCGVICFVLTTLALLGIAWQHFRRSESEIWVRFATRVAYTLAVLGPLVPLTVLYLASWRASVVLGHWPQIWTDDPSNCASDPWGGFLRSNFSYFCAFAGGSVLSCIALFLHLRTRIPYARWLWIGGVFLLAWTAFGLEPGGRLVWWLD